jgi:hypothetical protein
MCVHDWQLRRGPGLVCVRCSVCGAFVALRGVLARGQVWVQVIEPGPAGVTEQELLAVVRGVIPSVEAPPLALRERGVGEVEPLPDASRSPHG